MATSLLASRAIALPSLRSNRIQASRVRLAVVAQAKAPSTSDIQAQLTRVAGISTAVSTFLVAGNAQAAQEIAQLAAGDNRFGTITLLFLPVIGWVLFNILGPAKNQVDAMTGSSKTAKRRGIAAAIGAGAGALMVANADAASEIAQVAAGDNRFGTISLLFLPVVGWVLFNILGPANNQIAAMTGPKAAKRRGIAAAIGAGASALMVANADAASEIAQVAAGDNRFGTISLLFLPVIGWVLFNILGPANNQIAAMTGPKAAKRRGIAAAIGAGASALMVANADAASEIAQIAAKDNRFATIALLFVPALGWVLFNILNPAKNQIDAMTGAKTKSKKK